MNVTRVEDLDLSLGHVLQAVLDDGSTRLMRDLPQMFCLSHVWLDIASGRVVSLVWLRPAGRSKGPYPMTFRHIDGERDAAFNGAKVVTLLQADGSPFPDRRRKAVATI